MFTLKQIETFRQVMRTRTTVGAANVLKVSQPAVSNAIRQMEDRVGFPLFERLGNRLIPTPDANEIYQDSESIFKIWEAFNHRIEARRLSQMGSLRLVATPPIASALIPGFLGGFLGARQDVRFHIDLRRISGVLDAVETRMADVGLGLNPPPREGLRIEVLGWVRLVCCFAPGHRFEALASISQTDLENERLILYEPGSPFDNLLQGTLSDSMRQNAIAEVGYTSLACQMAEAELGVAIADALTAVRGARYTLETRPLEADIKSPVCAIIRDGEPQKRLLSTFMNELRESDWLKPA